MKVKLIKTFGNDKIEIEAEGKNEKEIFPQLEFWSSLPAKHPSGALDLKFAARPARTQDGKNVKYYEVICESADERLMFGQATDEKGGGLFPKGWEPIYRAQDESGHTQGRAEQEKKSHHEALASENRPSGDGQMTQRHMVLAEIKELLVWPADQKRMNEERVRQLKSFNADSVTQLTDAQLPKLKDGLALARKRFAGK